MGQVRFGSGRIQVIRIRPDLTRQDPAWIQIWPDSKILDPVHPYSYAAGYFEVLHYNNQSKIIIFKVLFFIISLQLSQQWVHIQCGIIKCVSSVAGTQLKQ